MENGVCISIIGNMSLIPEDLRQLMAKAMLITKDNDKAYLNIAFAYTCENTPNISVKTPPRIEINVYIRNYL